MTLNYNLIKIAYLFIFLAGSNHIPCDKGLCLEIFIFVSFLSILNDRYFCDSSCFVYMVNGY